MRTIADCLEIIAERAQANWGERWLAALCKKYVEVLQKQGEEATYESRKRTVYRAFEEKTCSTKTLFDLVEAAGCKLMLVCTEVRVLE